MEHPQEPESIPSDGVRRKGKRDAAPAATKQATQGKGLEGTKRRGDTEKREGEKADRRQDALRRSLKVALTPDGPLVAWGAGR